jgi:hypothetical protein
MMPGYMGMDMMSGQGEIQGPEVQRSPRMEHWKHSRAADKAKGPRIEQEESIPE